VLARKSGVIGIAELASAGTPQHDAVTVERQVGDLAFKVAYEQFLGYSG
jgi:hypothetical protein